MTDPWLDARLKNPEFRARLGVILLAARICAVVSIIIGVALWVLVLVGVLSS